MKRKTRYFPPLGSHEAARQEAVAQKKFDKAMAEILAASKAAKEKEEQEKLENPESL